MDELKLLQSIYLKAERDILQLIERQRNKGHVDYSSVAQLERVQKILQGMVNSSFKYIPIAIEKEFYIGKKLGAAKGYANARRITSSGQEVIKRLIKQLENRVIGAIQTTKSQIQYQWFESLRIARLEEDDLRKNAIKSVIKSESTGGLKAANKIFADTMKEQGLTGFIDKKNKKWSLSVYANMATRTTMHQAVTLGTIDDDWDLYKMSSHANACPICAAYQGRVYSKSGKDPNYPPLASAFGKVDISGPNTLENTYLSIHPNCLHTLVRYTERGRSKKDIEEMRNFSSFKTNPPNINKQSEEELKAYRNKERGDEWLNTTYRQWQKYKEQGVQVPTFRTFMKHKLEKDDKYKSWVKESK